MSTLGLLTVLKMGCFCGKESLTINNRRFFVRSRLGEGGFSVIDLLEDARSHKLYALKRITCHGKMDERVAMQEVEVMKTFKSKNVVPLEEDAMITVGRHMQSNDPITEVLIVMPFYKRGSLQDKIDILSKKNERMKEEDIWLFFLGICSAVKDLHSHSPPYAHRDIKPANVMIDDSGEAVLMDLGSANKARVEIKTRSEAQALQIIYRFSNVLELDTSESWPGAGWDDAAERCSMLYRPPELFSVEPGTSIDERTDIWSLGCTLYALAFLESPYEKTYQRGDSIALAVMSDNLNFPSYSGYSSSIESVIRQCMKVNAMERPFIDQILTEVGPLVKISNTNV